MANLLEQSNRNFGMNYMEGNGLLIAAGIPVQIR